MSTDAAPARRAVLLLLALSATALACAPLFLPESYSWVAQTTSESAAQGLQGAWVARLGFLLFGFGVLWLSRLSRDAWGIWGFVLLGCFGVMMVGTAAFSHRPWLPGAPFDPIEDLLHSVTATVMGFAFAAGVVAVGLGRSRAGALRRAFDLAAVAASVLLPIAMGLSTTHTGLLQRTMFLIAYLWYAGEALRPEDGGSA